MFRIATGLWKVPLSRHSGFELCATVSINYNQSHATFTTGLKRGMISRGRIPSMAGCPFLGGRFEFFPVLGFGICESVNMTMDEARA